MRYYTVSLDLASALAPPDRCESCGAVGLTAVPGEQVSFLCRSCGLCWEAQSGWIHRVDRRNAPPAADERTRR